MSDLASSRPSPDEPSDRALDPGAGGGHAPWTAEPRSAEPRSAEPWRPEPWSAEPWSTDPWQIGAGHTAGQPGGPDGDAHAVDPLADVIADLAELADPAAAAAGGSGGRGPCGAGRRRGADREDHLGAAGRHDDVTGGAGRRRRLVL
ncbi:hypothetical protein OHA72_63525 [Dactylosporangium sp. NBC_01737]|uniref:hypothetical protein n=1 Tax=Dactylosporangium sp. NBC_01737 TaxID=2975959 RepID=UPI002E145D1C|nr:hypothetical protein OHA72_63525 [Dactylosporangium sp. NBC_01737]